MERRNFLRGKSDSGFHYDEQENITTLCCSRSVKQAILRRRNYLCTINEDKARTFSGVLDEVKLSKGAVSKGRKRERGSPAAAASVSGSDGGNVTETRKKFGNALVRLSHDH